MTTRIARIVGLLAVAALLAAACGDDSGGTADDGATDEPVAEPLPLDDGEMVAFRVTGEVTEASEGAPIPGPAFREPSSFVGEFLHACYALSADGTFDDTGFPLDGPVPGTWERDGTDSSFTAEIDGGELTLDFTGSVTVDENGDRELTGESTLSLGDTTVLRSSDTGVEMDIDDFNNRQFLCQNPPPADPSAS